MKPATLLITITLATGAAAFGVTQWLRHHQCQDECAWLRDEFGLDEQQIAAIRQLREAYGPICKKHCDQIASAKSLLADLRSRHPTDHPEVVAAQSALDTISRECATATRKHMEAIAAIMPPAQGRRYLDMVGPKLTPPPSASR